MASFSWEQIQAITIAIIGFGVHCFAAGHAVLHKHDVRAAIGWVGLIWFLPVGGPILYLLFGINRIRRRATSLMEGRDVLLPATERASIPPPSKDLQPLALYIEAVTRVSLVPGNHVSPLVCGEQAYPAMLDAIAGARQSVALSTYIFDNDSVGREFVEALSSAQQRGVEVRVLIDAVGMRYSFPSIARSLHRAAVPVARFMPTRLPWRLPYATLRNHRKLLIVDGNIAFTGGMNIRQGHLIESYPDSAVRDIHFKVKGPVIDQLLHVFKHDWSFSTGEILSGEAWSSASEPAGTTVCRTIADGPDEDFGTMLHAFLGAIACAQKKVRIMTPYFIPISGLSQALSVAARRGVEVDIVLPEKGNLRMVQWASTALLWEPLAAGCRVWLNPPPFDHSKVLLVDDAWSLIGSSNWDPVSLRLNFELGLECWNPDLAEDLSKKIDQRLDHARCLSLEDVDGRSLPIRLRDGIARLASPYL